MRVFILLALVVPSQGAVTVGEHGELTWYQSGAGVGVCDTLHNGFTYTFTRGGCTIQAKVYNCGPSAGNTLPCECEDIEVTETSGDCGGELEIEGGGWQRKLSI